MLIIESILLLIGLFALYQGGEMAVISCVNLSKYFKISTAFIAAVIIGFGTSLPEFMASFIAAYRGNSGIAIGNIVGSNIANILLVYALAITLSPFAIGMKPDIKINLSFMIIGFLIVSFASFAFGEITFIIALLMLLCFACYLFFSFRYSKIDASEAELTDIKESSLTKSIIKTIASIILLIVGAQLTVDNAAKIATALNVPESLIATSIIALGTSLPEIVTTITATRMKLGTIIVGNILGSCIFNILAVLGFTALLIRLPIEQNLINFDIPIMLMAGLICFFYVLSNKNYRAYGIFGIMLYVGYIGRNFYYFFT